MNQFLLGLVVGVACVVVAHWGYKTFKKKEEVADPLSEYAERVLDYQGGLAVAAGIYVGDHLKLYEGLKKMSPTTSETFAKHMGLSERWMTEWLRGQAAAGLLDYKEGAFSLSPEGITVLTDKKHLSYQAGAFMKVANISKIAQKVVESFKTGKGFDFDTGGATQAEEIERSLAPCYYSVLHTKIIPKLHGMDKRLAEGAMVADIGCGAGVALIELAKRHPKSTFVGYDISKFALERARMHVEEEGLKNVSFVNPFESPLPEDGRYDLILTLDALHDMSDPKMITVGISKALKADGKWLVVDINTKGDFETNVKENPLAKYMYAWSMLFCLPCSLGDGDGAGLGTLGLTKDYLAEMTKAVGLNTTKVHDIGNPFNIAYEISH